VIAMPHVEGVRHRDVVVRGLRLHVAEAGEGEAVVLQHGWPQHWWEWRHLIPALAERYRVICPDLRGFGWSEAPPDDDYRKESMVDDLLALLGELGVDRIRYVGHDWGGLIGFVLCLRPEHPVERMVLMSAAPPWPPPGGVDPKRVATFAYQLPIVSLAPGAFKTKVSEALLRAGRADGGFSSEELETYLAPIRLPSGSRATTRLYRTFMFRELLPMARGKYLERRLSVPTRFLMGKKDIFYGPELEDLLRSNADDIELEAVEGASHFLAEERPELVRDRVLDFFESPA
jgi:pimeloyl-ACP methyl ester carboxylesterase